MVSSGTLKCSSSAACRIAHGERLTDEPLFEIRLDHHRGMPAAMLAIDMPALPYAR
jgi:hypothetical protein